jgi:hypothetical protein
MSVIETTESATAVEPIMSVVNDYFTVGGKPFRGSVFFWASDPNRENYVKVLLRNRFNPPPGEVRVGIRGARNRRESCRPGWKN